MTIKKVAAFRAKNGVVIFVSAEVPGSGFELAVDLQSGEKDEARLTVEAKSAQKSGAMFGTAMVCPREGCYVFQGITPKTIVYRESHDADTDSRLDVPDVESFFSPRPDSE